MQPEVRIHSSTFTIIQMCSCHNMIYLQEYDDGLEMSILFIFF